MIFWCVFSFWCDIQNRFPFLYNVMSECVFYSDVISKTCFFFIRCDFLTHLSFWCDFHNLLLFYPMWFLEESFRSMWFLKLVSFLFNVIFRHVFLLWCDFHNHQYFLFDAFPDIYCRFDEFPEHTFVFLPSKSFSPYLI